MCVCVCGAESEGIGVPPTGYPSSLGNSHSSIGLDTSLCVECVDPYVATREEEEVLMMWWMGGVVVVFTMDDGVFVVGCYSVHIRYTQRCIFYLYI